MPFKPTDQRRRWTRTLSKRDLDLIDQCKQCPLYKTMCEGLDMQEDSRHCDVDCEMCRAVCCYRAGREPVQPEEVALVEPWESWQIEWPSFLWTVAGKVPECATRETGAFMLAIDSLIDRRTLHWWRGTDLRAKFQLPKSALLGLTFCFSDWFFDYLVAGHEDGMWDCLARYDGIDFVIAPNWSVYTNYPQLDQLINLRRRWDSMGKAQSRGFKVVPDLVWVDPLQVSRVSTWLEQNRPQAVHFNFQTLRFRTRTAFRAGIKGVFELRDKLPGVQFVLSGIGPTRAAWLKGLSPATLISSAAWTYAELKLDMQKRPYRGRGWTTGQLFDLNTRTMEEAATWAQAAAPAVDSVAEE